MSRVLEEHGHEVLVANPRKTRLIHAGTTPKSDKIDAQKLARLARLDPERFAKSRSVGAYVGLVAGRDQSGDSDPQKRISKEGDEMLRRLLVGSAHYIMGPFGEDSDLRRHGQKLVAGGGLKRTRKRAVVAVGRKLSVLVQHPWSTGEVYDPLRNATRRLEEIQERQVVVGEKEEVA